MFNTELACYIQQVPLSVNKIILLNMIILLVESTKSHKNYFIMIVYNHCYLITYNHNYTR